MLVILYIVLWLNIFTIGHECYFVFKNGENDGQNNNLQMPSDLDLIYRKFANPLKKIADLLPDHNVEVQLEMIGNNDVPIKTTKINLMHFQRQPQNRAVRLRELNIGEEDQNMLHQHTTIPAAAPTVFYQPIQQINTLPALNRIPPVVNHGPNQMNPDIFMRNADDTQTSQSPASSVGEGERPVYMADLKRAFEDFEKKFLNAEKESKQLFPSGDKNSEIEEGKKPLLKKDLWMAMGCPHVHDHKGGIQNVNTSPPSIEMTQRVPVQFQNPPSLTDSKISRIMALLKGGIKVNGAGATPDKDDIQWLQVKIPKHG